MKLYDDQLFVLVDALRAVKNISNTTNSFAHMWDQRLTSIILNIIYLNDQHILEFGYYKLVSILSDLNYNCPTHADQQAKNFLKQTTRKLAPLIFTIQK